MKASRRPYYQFKPEERVRLALAATARGDTIEVARLRYSCPPEQRGEFTELLDRLRRVAGGVLLMWLNRSHQLVRARFALDLWPDRIAVEKIALRLAPPAHRKELKNGLREDCALLITGEAKCKQWSAEWKGIEAGIMRFCAGRGLTMQQLFAGSRGWLPPAIDEARADLDADVPADPQMEEELYQELCRMMAGSNAGGRG